MRIIGCRRRKLRELSQSRPSPGDYQSMETKADGAMMIVDTIGDMPRAIEFLSAAHAAAEVRRALDSGNTSAADRFVAEIASRIILAPEGTPIPDSILDEPESTGSQAYDTLLATALAFSLERRGLPPLAWMRDASKLPAEWLWDGGYDVSAPFKEFIRKSTPEVFRSKNILLRERDLIAP